MDARSYVMYLSSPNSDGGACVEAHFLCGERELGGGTACARVCVCACVSAADEISIVPIKSQRSPRKAPS